MAASDTEICNMALSHLGAGKEIANLETEKSQEATACRRFFETARDATLRDFAWPFATKIIAAGLIEEDPNDEWAYSYRYPTDCLMIRRILSGSRVDTPDTRIEYKIGQDDDGQLFYTDREEAEIEYTLRIDDPQRYPADFVLAFSLRLAAYIAPRITGGDPFKLSEKVMKLYQYEISTAQKSASNEEYPAVQPDSELISVR